MVPTPLKLNRNTAAWTTTKINVQSTLNICALVANKKKYLSSMQCFILKRSLYW